MTVRGRGAIWSVTFPERLFKLFTYYPPPPPPPPPTPPHCIFSFSVLFIQHPFSLSIFLSSCSTLLTLQMDKTSHYATYSSLTTTNRSGHK